MIEFKIYYALPYFLQKFCTIIYFKYRKFTEWLAVSMTTKYSELKEKPNVVYIAGLHRSGTSLLKNYFGDYPGLEITPFNPRGFFIPWKKSLHSKNILVDKSNHYIYEIRNIYKAYREHIAVCCIVRDPRDVLLSLVNFTHAKEVPRTDDFWRKFWLKFYKTYIEFATDLNSEKKRFYLIRYEDLVRYPCQAKKHFVNWLGFEVNTELISAEYTLAFPDEHQDPKVKRYREINQTSVTKWKSVKNQKTLKLIESWKNFPEVGNLMKKFGYVEDGIEEKKLDIKGIVSFYPEI